MSVLLLAGWMFTALAGPDLADRVPDQRTGDPFSQLTLGAQFDGAIPVMGSWVLPTAAGGFQPVDPIPTRSFGVSVGGLHHYGHGEWFVTFPVVDLPGEVTTQRGSTQVRRNTTVATGLHYYPFELARGTVRPWAGVDLGFQVWSLAYEGPDSTRVGLVSQVALPLSLGLGWRGSGWLVDAGVGWFPFGRADVYGGTSPQRLVQEAPEQVTRALDLRDLRVTVSVKGLVDVTPSVMREGFEAREAAALERRLEGRTASGLTLAAGPGGRMWRAGSDYFTDHRPYLRPAHSEGLYLHATAGYYSFPLDAELRAGWRRVAGGGTAYGASMENRQDGAFLEAIKLFDVNLAGFVPFLGGGAGHLWTRFADLAGGVRTIHTERMVVPTVVFGWDIRIAPSQWWLLRTSLRLIPVARSEVAADVVYDHGGLEYDYIQFLWYPQRLFQRRGRKASEGS